MSCIFVLSVVLFEDCLGIGDFWLILVLFGPGILEILLFVDVLGTEIWGGPVVFDFQLAVCFLKCYHPVEFREMMVL